MTTVRRLLFIGHLLIGLPLLAQVPQAISYQAVLRDPSSGLPMSNSSGTFRFVLHTDSPTGPIAYAEDHAFSTNDQGSITLAIGSGTATTGTFNPAAWSQLMFLETQVDMGSTGTLVSMGTQQLLSVPFALRAGKSSNVPDGTEVGQLMHWDGTTWVSDSGLYVYHRRFGIGDQQPEAPLSIVHRNILKSFFAKGDKPTQRQRGMGISVDSLGFGFSEGHIDSLRNRLFIQSSTGHVGLGTNDPPAPLTIESRSVLKTYFQTGDVPSQNDFALLADSNGFSFDQGTPGALTSRFFIQASTGNIGVGTSNPDEKYHVLGLTHGHHVGMRISNAAVSSNQGWVLGHLNDEVVAERNGAFTLDEGINGLTERVTVLPGGNVGINETLPHATLHVTRPTNDPSTQLSLSPNSGIAMFGEDQQHIVLDDQGIQARHLLAGATSLAGTAGSLRLQPLGGELLVHGDDTDDERKVIVRSTGEVGVGILSPMEKLHVNGAVVVGNTDTPIPVEGTIRYNGTDFEGRTASGWAIFNGSTWEKVGNTNGIALISPPNAKVGIGVSTPVAPLHVEQHGAFDRPSTGQFISLIDSYVSLTEDRDLVGLRVQTSGTGTVAGLSKNIGIHVSDVSGQTAAENNLAAVLNGNVVIGNLRSQGKEVGGGGTNVFVIQNGTEPASIGAGNGTTDDGVQLYVTTDAAGVSTLNIKNGNGDKVKLFKGTAVTVANNADLTPGTLDPATEAVINNMRTRINELEARLQALGLLH
jgi:hypothetical protein